MIDIDFGAAEKPKPLEAGVYVATISDTELDRTKKAKESGEDKFWLALTLEVNEPHEFNGRKIYGGVYIDPTDPGSLWNLKNFVQAVSRSEQTGRMTVDADFFAQMVGEAIQVTLVSDKSNLDDEGNPRTKIKSFGPL